MWGAKKIQAAFFVGAAIAIAAGTGAATSPPSLAGLTGTRSAEICMTIQGSVAEGQPPRTIARTAIELGHPACVVVRCALEGGGDLKEVVAGAREAGASPEVVAQCAVDAGADEAAVAAILALPEVGPRLCYFEPPDGGLSALLFDLEDLPERDPLPPEQPRRTISPHRFDR